MNNSDIIKRRIASKYNVTVELVEEIIKHPFYIMKDVIENTDRKKSNFANFRIYKWGIFYVTAPKRAFLKWVNSDEFQEKRRNRRNANTPCGDAPVLQTETGVSEE